ncbi:MAG: PilZ domain-containing protein [Nitrospirota bacterium]
MKGLKKKNIKMNKREYYRVRYPIACRPNLAILNSVYEIMDISEHGIKFLGNDVSRFHSDMKIDGMITFDDGISIGIKGKIIRIDRNNAVMFLMESIPFGRIVAEQRFIKVKYPEYGQDID